MSYWQIRRPTPLNPLDVPPPAINIRGAGALGMLATIEFVGNIDHEKRMKELQEVGQHQTGGAMAYGAAQAAELAASLGKEFCKLPEVKAWVQQEEALATARAEHEQIANEVNTLESRRREVVAGAGGRGLADLYLKKNQLMEKMAAQEEALDDLQEAADDALRRVRFKVANATARGFEVIREANAQRIQARKDVILFKIGDAVSALLGQYEDLESERRRNFDRFDDQQARVAVGEMMAAVHQAATGKPWDKPRVPPEPERAPPQPERPRAGDGWTVNEENLKRHQAAQQAARPAPRSERLGATLIKPPGNITKTTAEELDAEEPAAA